MNFQFLALPLVVLILVGCQKDFCPKPGDKDKWGNLIYAVHCDTNSKRVEYKLLKADLGGGTFTVSEYQNINGKILKLKETIFQATGAGKDIYNWKVPDTNKVSNHLISDRSYRYELNEKGKFYVKYERVFDADEDDYGLKVYDENGNKKDLSQINGSITEKKEEIQKVIKLFENYDTRVERGYYTRTLKNYKNAMEFEKSFNIHINLKINYDKSKYSKYLN